MAVQAVAVITLRLLAAQVQQIRALQAARSSQLIALAAVAVPMQSA
jgi:hypothetical protein